MKSFISVFPLRSRCLRTANLTSSETSNFCFFLYRDYKVEEEFRAALVLAVKSPNSQSYNIFNEKLKQKMAEAPFFSDFYVNKSGQIVSSNVPEI